MGHLRYLRYIGAEKELPEHVASFGWLDLELLLRKGLLPYSKDWQAWFERNATLLHQLGVGKWQSFLAQEFPQVLSALKEGLKACSERVATGSTSSHNPLRYTIKQAGKVLAWMEEQERKGESTNAEREEKGLPPDGRRTKPGGCVLS